MRMTVAGRIVVSMLALVLAGCGTESAPVASRAAEVLPKKPIAVVASAPAAPVKYPPACLDGLGATLYRAGFRGKDLREAWSIAMRESNGEPTKVSNGVDVGLFQFNYPSHRSEKWWDWDALRDARYNARVAYRVSRGGRDWSWWGLTGSGTTDPSLYGSWSRARIKSDITDPYQKYYGQYPC